MRPPLNPPLTSSLGGFVLSQLAQSTHPYPPHSYQKFCAMTTSSNGNIFRVTGPLCGEFTGPGEFPTQRPVTRSFDVFFDLRLNKRLSKQPRGWWFERQSWSLWRHGKSDHRDWYSAQVGLSGVQSTRCRPAPRHGQVKSSTLYFIDRFKATGPYKRNNTNNYNKITNTTLYQIKIKSTWRLLNSSECQIHIFTHKPDGFTVVWA